MYNKALLLIYVYYFFKQKYVVELYSLNNIEYNSYFINYNY